MLGPITLAAAAVFGMDTGAKEVSVTRPTEQLTWHQQATSFEQKMNEWPSPFKATLQNQCFNPRISRRERSRTDIMERGTFKTRDKRQRPLYGYVWILKG